MKSAVAVRKGAQALIASRASARSMSGSVANLGLDIIPEGVHGVVTPSSSAAGPAPAAETTTLPNGVKVTSQDAGGHVSSIGVYIAAGSRNENAANAGAAHVLQNMAFKSTHHRTDLRIYRDLEDIGASISSTAGRELLSFRVDALRDEANNALNILTESVSSARFVPWEVESAKDIASVQSADAETDPHAIVLDALHATAFGADSPLGRPAVGRRHDVAGVSPEAVAQYAAANFSSDRIVVAATGMDHATLVNGVEAGLQSLTATGGGAAAETATYTGGQAQIRGLTTEAYIGLAFSAGGWNSDDLFANYVLQALLGGGAKHSTSRAAAQSLLSANVLDRLDFVTSANAFGATYSDAGLVGVVASVAEGSQASAAVSAIAAELKQASKSAVGADALARAKNTVKANVCVNLDSRNTRVEDLATQTMFYGSQKYDDSQLLAKIDAVTAADVKRAAAAALASRPTFVTFGDVASAPTYEEVVGMLA